MKFSDREVLTPEERLRKTINLEIPDRVPVVPKMDFFAPVYAKVPMGKYLSDPQAGHEALEKTFYGLGGWDSMYPPAPPVPFTKAFGMPMKMRVPGRDLPEDSPYQLIEEQVMFSEDYDTIIQKGWNAFFMETLLPRIRPEVDPKDYGTIIGNAALETKKGMQKWAERGVSPSLEGGKIAPPFDLFSMARTLPEFIMDLRYRKDKVMEASAVATPEIIATAKRNVGNTGVKRVFNSPIRSDNTLISPKQFHDIALPFLKQMVEALWQDGIVTLLHCDQDWELNLPHLLELPRASCVLQLDGFTDIFKAKEVLKDHMCLMGDVPPTLLTLGSPQEVEEYCEKLVKVVGEGGGFIMSSGCDVPMNARPENVKMMLDVAKRSFYD